MKEYESPAISKQHQQILKGVLIAGYGLLLLGYKLDAGIPKWAVSWEAVLIFVGVYSGIKENFKNNAWIVFILVGAFFLLDDVLPNVHISDFIWPLVIITAGVLYVLKPSKRFNKNMWGPCGQRNNNTFKEKAGNL